MKCIWQKKSFRVVLRMCLFVDCCGFWQKLWWNTISMRLLPCLQRKSQLTWPIIKAENHSSSLLDYNQKISFLQLQPYATPDITHCGKIRFLTKKTIVEVDKIKFYFLVKIWIDFMALHLQHSCIAFLFGLKNFDCCVSIISGRKGLSK